MGLCVLWWSVFYLSLFLDWSCCVYQCWAWGVELASKSCHGSNSISGWRFFLLNLDYSCAYCGELLTWLFSLSWCPTYTGQVMSHLLLDLNNTVRCMFLDHYRSGLDRNLISLYYIEWLCTPGRADSLFRTMPYAPPPPTPTHTPHTHTSMLSSFTVCTM